MEWMPNDKMTNTDLRAVLNSWGVPTLSSDKMELQMEVARQYKNIMREWMHALPDRRAIFSASRSRGAPASTTRHDQGVGTDTPLANFSFIGSEEPGDIAQDDELDNTESAACAAAPNDEPANMESAACAAAAPKDEPGNNKESAACAAAHDDEPSTVDKQLRSDFEEALAFQKECECQQVFADSSAPSLRKAVDKELKATIVKTKAKQTAKDKNTIYGYLPRSAVFIDKDLKKDLKKDGDKDNNVA